jgi:predicted ATPase/DNA-binding XRE family transcriptional regulator
VIQLLEQPETTSSFGYWVRRQRLALDLTQADLARLVNCAKITITKIEHDERRPSRQMANLLADHLAIPDSQRAHFVAAGLGEQAPDHLPLATTPQDSHTPEPLPSNLPSPATPFVGREIELQQLVPRLHDPACRLLTLLGAGGFGKTRLALRLGELALAEPVLFPDGVFFMPLDGLEDSALVVPAVAAALDFSFHEQQAQDNQLLSHLAHKRLLLILDNAEEILDPGLVDRILVRARAVKIVVTTREALHLEQEWTYPILGMRVSTESGGEDISSSEYGDAIDLFYQCALRSRPDFDLARDFVNVQQICRLVDGAPLAIVLAAAWLKALPAAQIARELEHDVELLASTHRNVPDRHRSMRAVLQQSWHYLEHDEQSVFRRLSIFEGGFTLEAARSVTGAPLSVLSGLVDKSMLQLGLDGRYRIHALLRQLGVQRAAENAEELVICRSLHAEYFLMFLADRSTAIAGPDQHEVLREIQEEFENIRTAWLCAAERGPNWMLRASMPTLFRFLWLRGRYEEGRQLAGQALAVVDVGALAPEEQPIRVALMAYCAQLTAILGSRAHALSLSEIALVAAEELGALSERAQCHYVMGMVQAHLRDANRAEANLWAAYNLYHELGDVLSIAEVTLLLVYVKLLLKCELQSCLALVEESLELFRQLGDTANFADALNQYAALCWGTGEIDKAEQLYQETLDLAVATGSRYVELQAIGGFALVALARLQWDLAISQAQQRLLLAQTLGHDAQVQSSLIILCRIYTNAERYNDAVALIRERPEMWRTGHTAQAHIGAGAFEEALTYLVQVTEHVLATNHLYYIAVCLIAWAMLLESHCELHSQESAPLHDIMTPAERDALAYETLQVVRDSDQIDWGTRQQADRLLARLRSKPNISLADAEVRKHPFRSLQELGLAMLSIRLA